MNLLDLNDKAGAYPPSLYAKTAEFLPPQAAAQGRIDCDVVIVGAGFTGLSAAITLAQQGYRTIILEAHRIGWGASGRNGGQVNVGQRLEQDTLEKRFGPDTARLLWELSLESVAKVKTLINTYNIDAEAKPGIAYLNNKTASQKHSQAYVNFLHKRYDYDKVQLIPKESVQEYAKSDNYKGGLFYEEGIHLNPLKYALGLGRSALNLGVQIYENSRVLCLEEKKLITEKADIHAPYILLACNGYLGHLYKPLARKVMPINSFILATEPLSSASEIMPKDAAVADDRFVVNYYRISKDRRLVFGGTEAYGYKFPSDIKVKVQKRMLNVFPQLKNQRIDYAWGGTLGITSMRMPVFAQPKPWLFTASGYSGHGIAMATLGGEIAAKAIIGQNASFNLMANLPIRSFPGGSIMRTPLLFAAMTWYALRDKLA